MSCQNPVTLIRKDEKNIPHRTVVPCGTCFSCLSRKRTGWSFRLSQELKSAKTAFFLTMTYNDAHISHSSLSKRDVQLFIKSLRQECEKVSKMALKWPKIKYYIVGEYGSKTFRPHYHCIIFNIPVIASSAIGEDAMRFVSKFWKHGFIKVGTVNAKSINYVTKYVIMKGDFPEGKEKPFSLMSTRPAIGIDYVVKMKKYHEESGATFGTLDGNIKVDLPRFYKDRIFTKEEREEQNLKFRSQLDEKEIKKIKQGKEKGKDPFFSALASRVHTDNLRKKRLTKNGKI